MKMKSKHMFNLLFCWIQMSYHRKINITIIILSSLAVFLQTLLLAIQTLYDTKIFQIIIAVINAALVTIQSVQLNLKKEAEKPSPVARDHEEDNGVPM